MALKPNSALPTILAIAIPWIIILALLFVLSSCAGMGGFDPESIGVDEKDNALLFICVELDPNWTESKGQYARIEAGQGVDLAQILGELSPDKLQALMECP